MSAHSIPLDLVAGHDPWMQRSMRLLACLAALAIACSAGAFLARASLCACLLCAWLWLERDCAAQKTMRIKIHPSGRCRAGSEDLHIDSQAWISPWYAVLTCSGAAGKRRFLVSAGQQDPGEYRKLLCWARFGRWDKPGRQT